MKLISFTIFMRNPSWGTSPFLQFWSHVRWSTRSDSFDSCPGSCTQSTCFGFVICVFLACWCRGGFRIGVAMAFWSSWRFGNGLGPLSWGRGWHSWGHVDWWSPYSSRSSVFWNSYTIFCLTKHNFITTWAQLWTSSPSYWHTSNCQSCIIW